MVRNEEEVRKKNMNTGERKRHTQMEGDPEHPDRFTSFINQGDCTEQLSGCLQNIILLMKDIQITASA